MYTLKLKDIATIRTGLILNRKRARDTFEVKQEYPLLTLQNIDETGFFKNVPFDTYQSKDILDESYLTQPGDIILRLNAPYTAVYIEESKQGIVYPNYFVAVTMEEKGYLPAFVNWYLNTDYVKRRYQRGQAGTLVPNINRSIILDLPIPEISLQKQEKIVVLHALHLKEQRLYQELLYEKQMYYKGFTDQIIRNIMGEN